MTEHDHSHGEHTHVHTHDGHKHVHGEHTHTHSPEHKKAVLNRMSRIIGHMESVKKMVENDRDCTDVLIQLSAVNSALQGVSRAVLKEHMSTCIVEAVQEDDMEALKELNDAIDKFMK
ncbi:MAG: metal-sensing transcriptional repressor [Firmicutes bacterium]|nr:metal-sensing transcriptional repressor [Bacillota bacterium]